MATETIQLKPEIIDQITANPQVYKRIQSRMQPAFDRSYFAIRRWLQVNDPMLTTVTALTIISEETGKTTEELLAR